MEQNLLQTEEGGAVGARRRPQGGGVPGREVALHRLQRHRLHVAFRPGGRQLDLQGRVLCDDLCVVLEHLDLPLENEDLVVLGLEQLLVCLRVRCGGG